MRSTVGMRGWEERHPFRGGNTWWSGEADQYNPVTSPTSKKERRERITPQQKIREGDPSKDNNPASSEIWQGEVGPFLVKLHSDREKWGADSARETEKCQGEVVTRKRLFRKTLTRRGWEKTKKARAPNKWWLGKF